jgi:alpha-L-rhamnosidase
MFGDISFLTESYASMKAHTLFQIGRTNRTGLFGKIFHKPDKKYVCNVGQAFGEWLEPKDVYQQRILNDFCAPHPEEATAYLSYVCAIMAEVARKLGHDADVPLFEEYHKGCKTAYVHQFTPVVTDRQSKLVRPLALNLLEGATAKKTFERLVAVIESRNHRIGTGFLSTPLILPLLTRMGRTDIAYRMMENEEQPGWLYEVKQGATTVWENWDGSASQNHYSPGSVCQWLFETVAGIKIGNKENSFEISPKPGGTLSYASASYESIYGKVACGWRKGDGKAAYIVEVSVPENTTAVVNLPDGSTSEVSAGRYTYRF